MAHMLTIHTTQMWEAPGAKAAKAWNRQPLPSLGRFPPAQRHPVALFAHPHRAKCCG